MLLREVGVTGQGIGFLVSLIGSLLVTLPGSSA